MKSVDSSDTAVDNSATLPRPGTTPSEPLEPTRPDPNARDTLGAYELGGVIGRGGMGEVVLARDPEIGRDVAIKRLRTEHPTHDALERFLREAKIQARLDHPAIVPVYELGRDASGQPYFTMKRLSGVTLAEHLENQDTPLQRLLRAFADVCLAVQFAHARQVIHRDLKPANIMLGDYGEVYVLDWGLGRELGGAQEVDSGEQPSLDGHTETGTMLGTPGYMAPEQIESAADVGRPADIYALGAILFEILVNEPLHPRGQGAIVSTLSEIDGSPARRRPERAIAPELDALCSAALDRDPARRPTAAVLAERVQRYLDGDRDVERRRVLARENLEDARAALAQGRRADAMRAAGRALALDPESPATAELVSALVLEPPATPSPELIAAYRDSDARVMRRHILGSAVGFFIVSVMVPLAVWNGVLSWRYIFSVLGLSATMGCAALLMARRPDRSLREMLLYAAGVAALIALLGRLCGPFVFVAAVASFVTTSACALPAFSRRAWIVTIFTLAGWAAPLICEQLGLLRPSWAIEGGKLVSMSYAIRLDGTPAAIMVVVFTVVTILAAGFHGGRIARAHAADRHRLVAQAWHLRQLLPVTAR